MIKIILLIIVLFSNCVYSYSQHFKISFDKTLKSKEIIATDTIVWEFIDTTQYEKRYPINCDVLFDGEMVLHTCNLKQQKDKYKLCFSKSSYGLKMDVVLFLTLEKGLCEGKVYYYEAADAVDRKFDILKCDLKLNKNKIKYGDIVQGEIFLQFNGKYADLETGKEIVRVGNIKGNFYVQAK